MNLRLFTANELLDVLREMKTACIADPSDAEAAKIFSVIYTHMGLSEDRYTVPPNLDQVYESHLGKDSITLLGNTVEFRAAARNVVAHNMALDVHVIWKLREIEKMDEVLAFLKGFTDPNRIVTPGTDMLLTLASTGKAKVFLVRVGDGEAIAKLNNLTHRSAEFAVIGNPVDPVLWNQKFAIE